MKEWFVPCTVYVLVEAETAELAKEAAKNHFKDDIAIDVDEIMEPEET